MNLDTPFYNKLIASEQFKLLPAMRFLETIDPVHVGNVYEFVAEEVRIAESGQQKTQTST